MLPVISFACAINLAFKLLKKRIQILREISVLIYKFLANFRESTKFPTFTAKFDVFRNVFLRKNDKFNCHIYIFVRISFVN